MKQILGIALALFTLVVGAEDIVGTVTGNLLNVRNAPKRNSSVVCKLAKGAKVSVIKYKSVWLGIRPPANSRAWIPSAALKGTTVSAEKVDVRLGPSDVFTAYASLKRGDTVQIIRTKHNKWTEIKAPATGLVWVHGDYVELPEKYALLRQQEIARVTPVDKTGAVGDPDKDAELVKIVKPLKGRLPKSLPMVPPKEYKIDELEGEPKGTEVTTVGMAKTVTRSGVIVKLNPNRKRPWNYALASQINNTFYPLFYIGNGFANLDKWEWHRVTITGEQHWIRGWPRPLVEVKKIKELPGERVRRP